MSRNACKFWRGRGSVRLNGGLVAVLALLVPDSSFLCMLVLRGCPALRPLRWSRMERASLRRGVFTA
jgi:hypothetical protein